MNFNSRCVSDLEDALQSFRIANAFSQHFDDNHQVFVNDVYMCYIVRRSNDGKLFHLAYIPDIRGASGADIPKFLSEIEEQNKFQFSIDQFDDEQRQALNNSQLPFEIRQLLPGLGNIVYSTPGKLKQASVEDSLEEGISFHEVDLNLLVLDKECKYFPDELVFPTHVADMPLISLQTLESRQANQLAFEEGVKAVFDRRAEGFEFVSLDTIALCVYDKITPRHFSQHAVVEIFETPNVEQALASIPKESTVASGGCIGTFFKS